ncbi:MAG: hypothetical protein UR26_C0001G0175 [candidate division TM6 bacterium GW2011_GWF2_32_72]|nr:MAG: hypothetical protein UR26_C0001G0175 [candidate division TM6 bacterium GW2011_GWF2_32_72]
MNIPFLSKAFLAFGCMIGISQKNITPIRGHYKLDHMSKQEAILPMVKAAQILVDIKKDPKRVLSVAHQLYAPLVQAAANESSKNIIEFSQMAKNKTEEIDNKMHTLSAKDKQCLFMAYLFTNTLRKTNAESINRHVDRLLHLTQAPGELNTLHQAISKLKGGNMFNIKGKIGELCLLLFGTKPKSKSKNNNEPELGDKLINQLKNDFFWNVLLRL